MLSARPTGLFANDYTFALDGRPLGILDQSGTFERAEITLEGVPYLLKNERIGRDLLLERDGEVLARASKRLLRRQLTVTIDPDGPTPYQLELEVSGFLVKGGRYTVTRDGRKVGELVKTPFARSASAHFPDDLPLPIRVFLLWIGLMMWRRERSD